MLGNINQHCSESKNDIHEHPFFRGRDLILDNTVILILAVIRVLPGKWNDVWRIGWVE